MRATSLRLLAVAPVCALVACSGAPGTPEGTEATGSSSAPILNGTPANAYPEAALVDMSQTGSLYGGYCSGALIAPQVVLTAGHCVKGESSAMGSLIPDTWKITLPYNNGQRFTSKDATTYDWQTTDGTVDPSTHDVGLVFLPTPATVTPDQCPALSTTPLGSNGQVVNIGRIQSGNLSMSDLFVGTPVSVAASQQFPFDYESQDIIEQGDSGGPDEVPGSTPHLIVAVNSGAGTGAEVLARVDLLNGTSNNWIQQQIMAHGGTCAAPSSSSGGSSGSSSGSSGGSSSGSSGGSTSGSTSGSGSSSGTSSTSGSSSGGSSGSTSGTSSGGSTSGGTSSTGGGSSSGSGTSSGSSTGSSGSASGSGGNSSGSGTSGSSSGSADNNAWSATQQPSGCSCTAAGGNAGASPGALAALGLASVLGVRARRRGTFTRRR